MTRPKQPPATASSHLLSDPEKASEAAFDVWLQRSLHQLFDKVAKEPIPEDLLRLIEENRKP